MGFLLDVVELTPLHRILSLWVFVLLGLVVAVQVSQTQAERPLGWTRLTETSRPFWYTLYTTQALLLFAGARPLLRDTMDGYAFGNEERILNGVWIGLVAIEALMVVGVVVRGVAKRYGPAPKQKAA